MSDVYSHHELTADQQRLVETIAQRQPVRLFVLGSPGTGKTYAVTSAVLELLARAPEARILLLCPGALTVQLVAKLVDQLDDAAPVTVVTGQSFLGLEAQAVDGMWRPGVYVASFELASRISIGASLAASAWDLVIVDEAHMLTGTRADFALQLAANEAVNSLVLLSAVPPRDQRLLGRFEHIGWKRTSQPEHRVLAAIDYERTMGERELYLQLEAFLDAHANEKTRDVLERAWRSSTSALEGVLVRQRSRLEINQAGEQKWGGEGSLRDPLLTSEQAAPYQPVDQTSAWKDELPIAAGLDNLLRHIASLAVDSKLEATLSAVDQRLTASGHAPCIVTQMRGTALYIAQAFESRQHRTICMTGSGPFLSEQELGLDGTVVVATDASLQGLELPADTLLSYDLPRSRLRVEQRWGRIDRVGRAQPATMLALRDLSAVDPIEETLLRLHGFG